MNKPRRPPPRPLSDLLHKALGEAFAKQGFASAALVTRWSEIAGAEIAAHSQPEKILWSRRSEGASPHPGTLVLRVEGPAAIEIQHMSGIILERVNRFFGWQAVADLRLRQAPLARRKRAPLPVLDSEAVRRLAAGLPEIQDEKLRASVARLGAAIKQS